MQTTQVQPQPTTTLGQQTKKVVDGGLWKVESGSWKVDGGLWMVDGGGWIVDGGW
eukprot:gene6349-11783_t